MSLTFGDCKGFLLHLCPSISIIQRHYQGLLGTGPEKKHYLERHTGQVHILMYLRPDMQIAKNIWKEEVTERKLQIDLILGSLITSMSERGSPH